MPITKKKNSNLRGVYKKRVQLASDVLKHLKSRRYLATTSVIYGFPLAVELTTATHQGECARDILLGVPQCEVCAKGGLFLAHVERFNHVTVSQLSWARSAGSSPHFLKGVFTERLLAEIETIYEQGSYSWNERVLGEDLTEKLVKFSDGLDDNDDKRLAQVMRRLIKNKGRYVAFPEVARES